MSKMKDLREAKTPKLSLEGLAKDVRVILKRDSLSKQFISKVERGEKHATADLAGAIARALDVEREDIFEGTTVPESIRYKVRT